MLSSGRAWLITLHLFALVALLSAAASAHAENGASWLILDEHGKLIDTANLHANVGAVTEEVGGRLLTKIAGLKIEISCNGGLLLGAVLLGNGTVSESTVEFSECLTYANGKLAASCVPHTAGAAPGVIKTKPISGLIVLHTLQPSGAVDELVLIDPVSGTTFATLEFGAMCALAEKISINGKLVVQEAGMGLNALEQIHLFVQGPLTELWVLSNTPEHAVKLDGAFDALLDDPHFQREWLGEAA